MMNGKQLTADHLASPLVPGLRLDPYRADVHAASAFTRISNACNAADGIDEFVADAQLAHWLRHATEQFDPQRDLVCATLDGQLIGYGWVDWVDTTDGLREFRVSGYVHPEQQGRGIGRVILAWEEAHARQAAAGMATDRALWLGAWCPEERARKRHLLERAGYEAARYFFDMQRPTLDEIIVPQMPDGLRTRPMGTDRAALKQLWDADVEAFADHWGGFDGSDAAFERVLDDPDSDPSLFVIVWDGDEIAGGVTNAIYHAENEQFGRKRGWLETVFVRRRWRRRGIGTALVARALVRLRLAGMTEAMLGVDSDNPSGALGLYERAGFRVHTRSIAYRRPLAMDQ